MSLEISGLDVRFGAQQVVSIDELAIGEAEICGLAGESGSGKSVTTLAVLGLAHTVGATVTGSTMNSAITFMRDAICGRPMATESM